MEFKITNTTSGNDYILGFDGDEWLQLSSGRCLLRGSDLAGGGTAFTFRTPAIPESGDLEVTIAEPWTLSQNPSTVKDLIINQLSVGVVDFNTNTGVQHTAERITAPSSVVASSEEFLVADEPPTIPYKGSLYLTDTTTRADGFVNAFIPLTKRGILQIHTEDRLRLQGKTLKYFSGDIYGHLDYFSKVSIDNLQGVFIMAAWSYDTREGIISLELHGFDFLIAPEGGIEHRVRDITGQVINPTLKG